MKKHCRIGLQLLGLILLIVASSISQALEYKGVGEVSYGMMLRSGHKADAEKVALRSAIERWVANEQHAYQRNFEGVKAEIEANIDDYVLNYTVIDSTRDKGRKVYKVVVRAELNEARLVNKLRQFEPDTPLQLKNEGDTYITFVFVAREHASTTSRDFKSATTTKSEAKGIGKNVAEDTATMKKSQSKTVALEKSEVRIADDIKWRVSTANEIDVAMGDVFTDANLLVIDAALLEEETEYLLEVENFIRDYQNGDDLQSSTKRDALKGLKSLTDPVHYLAIGTLDVDESMTDSVTGQIKVPVSVTGQILAVFKRGAAVAKVGPVQYIGLGPTITVAKNNALKLAAQEAAKTLVAKLSAKSIY